MSSRGRGGRGGGTVNKSFNREQLNSLGISANEVLPGPVTQPPPLYPQLERRPVPLTNSLEMDYLLILRQDFIDHMQLSGTYLKMPQNKSHPEQEIDKLLAQLPSAKEKFDWSLFPSELRPKVMAKRIKKKPVKEVNIEQRLSFLEKLENKSDNNNITVKVENDDEDEPAEDLESLEDKDEEMDDGTDYANNYFDNGENYEDEDDNLDDGPSY
ncbi:unnamed protein product [Phaedon cochleariae]|uniref:DNA-directed RNA polymerase III subunit n=1 Tax=Phaedon cochleariae TaxID=80249 RepID=A0A9P0DDS6_PHACE|nr:unnamed protein product [Phaedon cochleariae]